MKILAAMTFTKHFTVLFLFNLLQNDVNARVLDKREVHEGIKNVTVVGSPYEKSFFGDFEEKNLEQEILQELNHLSFRKQREIFDDLEKQNEKFNKTSKSLISAENEMLSPLNVEELRSIRKTIKTSNSSLPAIRNKRTLNLLLNLVARAMGYTLTPTNPDAEWLPRQQPQPSPQPCSTPAPPCRPNLPSTPPPCAMPPTTPPCTGAIMQPATIPPNQINPNTISYPFRPARTIPLFNFAPLPAGIRVPYPPLLQSPAQARSPCTPQQPSPPPCATPAPSPPPCATKPPPCQPTSPPSPPPCGTPPPPPCGTTPAPSPPPCATPAPQPPPCATTPAPKPQPCATTPAPPPCGTPAPPPPCTTPAPTPSPCNPPSPNPPPCASPPPPPQPPAIPPKKGSILLEYDDPVRIQIFSNNKKFLPASGNLYSGDYEDQQQDWHSHFFPGNEKSKNKDEDFEEEMQEEHLEEEEEDDETPRQLQHYEEEDEKALDEEDESETNLSVVKKPIDRDIRKTQRRKAVSSKTTTTGKMNEKEEEKKETTQKMKKPKRKKWVRIVKKQRRKTKTDSNPHENFQIYTSDSVPEGSQTYGRSVSKRAYYPYDFSDYSNDSGSQSTEDLDEYKKVTINKQQIHAPELENINPYAYLLEPEEARRAKLEKAVERYVEDYVEKQLGQELIKNSGIPKTTVFEYAPKNGPKIQTITTTVAKTSHSGPVSAKGPTRVPTTHRPYHRHPNGKTHVVRQSNYEQNSKRGNTYDALTRKF